MQIAARSASGSHQAKKGVWGVEETGIQNRQGSANTVMTVFLDSA